MAYCTVLQIRSQSRKLADVKITDAVITDRIAEAETQIKADLSGIISEADLDALGAASSLVNLLAIYKSTEKTFIHVFGIYRKADEIGDTDYFIKQYNNLLKKLLDGDIELTDAAGAEAGAADFPKATTSLSNLKLYPRKGVPDFTPDGVDGSYQDDRKLS